MLKRELTLTLRSLPLLCVQATIFIPDSFLRLWKINDDNNRSLTETRKAFSQLKNALSLLYVELIYSPPHIPSSFRKKFAPFELSPSKLVLEDKRRKMEMKMFFARFLVKSDTFSFSVLCCCCFVYCRLFPLFVSKKKRMGGGDEDNINILSEKNLSDTYTHTQELAYSDESKKMKWKNLRKWTRAWAPFADLNLLHESFRLLQTSII